MSTGWLSGIHAIVYLRAFLANQRPDPECDSSGSVSRSPAGRGWIPAFNADLGGSSIRRNPVGPWWTSSDNFWNWQDGRLGANPRRQL